MPRSSAALALALMAALVAGCTGSEASPTAATSITPTSGGESPALATAAPSSTPTAVQIDDPTSGELFLLAGVPEEFRDRCDRKTSDLPPGTRAAIECMPGDGPAELVGYYLLSDADDYYFDRVAEEGIEVDSGPCGADSPSGEGLVFGGIEEFGVEVRSACFINEPGFANLRMIDIGEEVYVGVLGRSDDFEELHFWATGSPEPGCTPCFITWLWHVPRED